MVQQSNCFVVVERGAAVLASAAPVVVTARRGHLYALLVQELHSHFLKSSASYTVSPSTFSLHSISAISCRPP